MDTLWGWRAGSLASWLPQAGGSLQSFPEQNLLEKNVRGSRPHGPPEGLGTRRKAVASEGVPRANLLDRAEGTGLASGEVAQAFPILETFPRGTDAMAYVRCVPGGTSTSACFPSQRTFTSPRGVG